MAGDMDMDGDVDFDDIACFMDAIGYCPFTNPEADYLCYPHDCLQGDLDGDGAVDFDDIALFTGLINDAMPWLVYTWDAENRLTSVGPGGYAEPPDGSLRVEFEYDYLGRRVWQYVESYDTGSGTWTVVSETKYVWAGWLMLMELDGLSSDAVLRRNTWGLDLAGQAGNVNSLEAAGGIGGLLAVDDLNGTPTYPFDDWECVFTYDANGNVAQVLDRTATTVNDALVAHYEYDPYGTVTNDLSGYAYAETNRWRFSTKQFDAATGLGYWGQRYYDSVLGRWLNHDPIEELGGQNLYAYVLNDPLNGHDARGEVAHWLAECGVGGIAGGLGGFFGGIRGGWQSGGCGALGGAASGCCSALICANMPPLCVPGSCICGAIGAFVTHICNGGGDWKDPCTWFEFVGGGLAGCLGGATTVADKPARGVIEFITGFDIGILSVICDQAKDCW